jgi:hypothetical protein
MHCQWLDLLTPATCWQEIELHSDDSRAFHHHLIWILQHQSENFIVTPRISTFSGHATISYFDWLHSPDILSVLEQYYHLISSLFPCDDYMLLYLRRVSVIQNHLQELRHISCCSTQLYNYIMPFSFTLNSSYSIHKDMQTLYTYLDLDALGLT